MKIDESCINHNAMRMISELSGNMWDYTDDEHGDKWRTQTLAYINGICEFADELNAVIRE